MVLGGFLTFLFEDGKTTAKRSRTIEDGVASGSEQERKGTPITDCCNSRWPRFLAPPGLTVLGTESDWVLVFDLMRRLEEDSRFTEDRIRIVVWYIW